MHLAAAHEQTEHRDLVRHPASAPSSADAAEIALIDLDFAIERIGRLGIEPIGDHLAQLVVEKDRRALIDTHQLGSCPSGHAGDKLDK